MIRSASDSLLGPRFSMVTSTSDLSEGRTSMAPSNVLRVTSGRPEVAKCFCSCSTTLYSTVASSRQPEQASAAVRARTARIGTLLRGLDGSRGGGVSRIRQLAAYVGLNHRKVLVE